jgi:hypothetical protein
MRGRIIGLRLAPRPDPRQPSNLYHHVPFINNAADHLTVYVDDIETPFVIGYYDSQNVSLQFGSHELTVVTEGPSAIMKCRFQIRMEGFPEPHGIWIERNGGGISISEHGVFGERRLY